MMKTLQAAAIAVLVGLAAPAQAQLFEIGTSGFTAEANNWPPGEAPNFAIDGFGQKYLNFGEFNTGVAVSPASNGVPTSITVWTANDAEERDPTSFAIYGLDGGVAGSPGDLIGGLNLIASGPIDLPSARLDGGNTPLGADSATVSFANTVAYDSYVIVFPTVKDAGAANSMQIAEVQLNEATGAPIFTPNDAILGGQIVVPEPTTVCLAAVCLAALVSRRRLS